LDWFSIRFGFGFYSNWILFFDLSLDIVERSTLFKIVFDVSFHAPFN
jgi:hypothetical protein